MTVRLIAYPFVHFSMWVFSGVLEDSTGASRLDVPCSMWVIRFVLKECRVARRLFVHFSIWVFTVFRELLDNGNREAPYGQGSLEVLTARNITSGAPDFAYMQKVSPG